MFRRPVQFYEFLSHHELIDEIYDSMVNPDLAVPVMTVLNILRKTNNLPPLTKETKSESKSTTLRNEGNKAYGIKKYQRALIFYNQAILFAPKASRAMKLAYSNRSALFLKIKSYIACLKDIETCFSMGCPPDIVEKLTSRKEEVRRYIWMEELEDQARTTIFSNEYFQLNVKRNPQIPCASAEVGVIIDNEIPKIVTTTDVKVGAVLAVEEAFVSVNETNNNLFSCFYCHKMNLNLTPCEGCRAALFCDEQCKEKCMKEYHSIECKIIEMIEALGMCEIEKLATRAIIKMQHMSKSWKEFIQASKSTGFNRIKNSSINGIYDKNYKFSLLNIKDERHLLFGNLYNASFTSAAVLHYLDKIVGFFPNNENERKEAQKATARLLMYFSLYANVTQITNAVTVSLKEKTEFHQHDNLGWFSFIGKLPHACNPNAIVVGMNKKASLVAISPIKKGTELTISAIGHWIDNPSTGTVRQKNIYCLNEMVCNCIICSGDYENVDIKLNEMQRKHFKKLNIVELSLRFNPLNAQEIYPKVCKAMALLNDVQFSEEYHHVFRLFRRCVLYLQDLCSDNVMLDYV